MEYVDLGLTVAAGLISCYHIWRATGEKSAYHAAMAAAFAVIATA